VSLSTLYASRASLKRSGASESSTTTYTPTTGLSDGWHTLYVAEVDSFGNWSYSTGVGVQTSGSGPNSPSVTVIASTTDPYPTWNWSSGGGGGNGWYRFKLDDSNLSSGATETASVSYQPGSPLSNGLHTLYVQETNGSVWSSSGSAITSVDVTAPNTPTGVSLFSEPAQVNLWWNASSGATSYKVYYDTSPGVSIIDTSSSTDSTIVTIHGLGIGTYYFAVSAYNSYGNESVFSDIISVDISGNFTSISANLRAILSILASYLLDE